MGFTETLKMIVTADTSQASSSFQKLGAQAEADIGKAEGATGRFDGAIGTLKANAVPILGAVAVGVFKLATEFEDSAIAAGKFATQTGLSTEQASKLTNVAGDLGVSTETLGTAMGRMLKNAGNTPKLFADLGVEIAKTNDGAVDSNATFENVIDHLKGIQDPARRAAEGTKLLGKGWAEVAPLIDEGSESLRRLEEATPENLIFHDEDVKTAKDMKAAFKDLGDAAENLGMALGKKVVPMLVEVAKRATDIIELGTKIEEKSGILGLAKTGADWITLRKPAEHLWDTFGIVKDAISGTAHETDASRKFYADAAKAMMDYGHALAESAEANKQMSAESAYAEATTLSAADAEKVYQSELKAGEQVRKDATEAAKIQAQIAKNVEDGVKAETKALEDNAKALQDDAKAMNDLINSAEDLAGATEDLSKATDDWKVFLDGEKAAIDEVNKSKDSATVKQAKLNDIYRDGIDKARAIADARVTERINQDQLNGVVTAATTKLDLQNQSMLQQASQAKGPLRDAILAYIGTVNQIPPDKLTEIKALIDQGKIAEANAALENASKTRTAGIKADADTAAAEKELDYAARNRTVTIKTQVNPSGSAKGNYGVDDLITPKPGQASGGTNRPGDITPVVEGGKSELLHENGRTYLLSGSNNRVEPLGSAGGAGGGGMVTNINVNVSVPLGGNLIQIGQQLAVAIRESQLKLNRTLGP